MARTSSSKPATFKLSAPQAKRVSVVGNFNNWDTKSNLAKKDSRGNWMVKLNLKPGKYEYKFFVDGQWVNDPGCKSTVPNSFGSHNSTVEIR